MVTRPGWTDEDRAWALALALREANTCSGCGGDLAETTDSDYLWRAEKPIVCLRCVGLHNAAEQHQKDPHHRAMRYPLVKIRKPKIGERKRGGVTDGPHALSGRAPADVG